MFSFILLHFFFFFSHIHLLVKSQCVNKDVAFAVPEIFRWRNASYRYICHPILKPVIGTESYGKAHLGSWQQGHELWNIFKVAFSYGVLYNTNKWLHTIIQLGLFLDSRSNIKHSASIWKYLHTYLCKTFLSHPFFLHLCPFV